MSPSQRATFGEHVDELRGRLFWVVLSVVVGAVAGYLLHDQLILLLQKPLNDTLYYTPPGGAFNFIIKVCTVFGLVAALPVLIYHVFGFFGPLIRVKTKRGIVRYVVASFLLAGAGISFAYFISLPAALHFLVSFGDESNIQSMITANEYFNFVLTYVAGFALLFQVPLLLVLTDRIKPLPPGKLLKSTRYVILASFVAAALITPTPDPMNQLLMAGPIIALYLLSASIVALRYVLRQRRHKRSIKTQQPLSLSRVTSSALHGYIMPTLEFISQPVRVSAMVATEKPVPKPRGQFVDIMAGPTRRKQPASQPRSEAQYTPRPTPRPVTPRLISDFMVVRQTAS
jgi:sec-independent protein translocase protein TatC